jgi:cobalt-zinc-cadmium efflux system protein
MSHSHQHHHHGHHHHGNQTNKKVLLISCVIIFTFMMVEIIGGILTNSLALLSDAGHMFSDASALILSLIAFKIGERRANTEKTYGYRRFEVLAAFLNGLTLIIISLYILWEAYHRLQAPIEVSSMMMYIAIIGFVVNILVAWILMRGDTEENLNMKSALLHVFGDLLGSAGAIIAGGLILLFGWNIADPIASIFVSILIFISGIRITKASIHVLMEGKPNHINLQSVQEKLLAIPGVKNIHDLHVWTITSGFPALSCHLTVEHSVDRDELLHHASHLLKEEFHLEHTTIQIEGEHSNIRDHEQNCN